MKDRRLLSVEILRLCITQHTPAKTDRAPPQIVDGKHHPGVEAIAQALLPLDAHVGAYDLLGSKTLRLQMCNELAMTR